MDKLLEYFLLEPEREFHVRELAKYFKKAPTTVSKYLNQYKKKNLLVSKKKFNHLLFKANTNNPLYKDIKLAYNIKQLRESGLIEFLEDQYNHPETIVLFGSFRKGENTPNSDIDILIISTIKKEVELNIFEKRLKVSIQLFVHSKADIENMKIHNKELLNNLINGISLVGYWEVF